MTKKTVVPREPLQPPNWLRNLSAGIIYLYAFITLVPLAWIFVTSLRTTNDAIAYPPKLFTAPSAVGFVNLFTTRTRVGEEEFKKLPAPKDWVEKVARDQQMVIAGPSSFIGRYKNSLIIGFGSTFLSIFLGTLAAYGFSRFKVPAKSDLLFFILSTRMMPPIAVSIPIFLMYRIVGLSDTHLGMILLYTVVNLSLAVWLLKGFMDEIPREYEEAAMIDGYGRLDAFRKIVLPQAATGIAATAIFCLIFSWNEYAFSLLLTSGNAQTAPPFIPTIIGEGGLDWPAMASATALFLLPVLVFTVLLRDHLLRGITFGAIRK